MARSRRAALVASALLAGGALAWAGWTLGRGPGSAAEAAPRDASIARTEQAAPEDPTFVGSEACARCHAAEHRAWTGSDHDRAMESPSPASVLGDFADATFREGRAITRFTREGERYVVTTAGPDGREARFEVAATFGVDPLQQLLLPLPGGRLQAFTVAWDARPRQDGGQRWYALPHDARATPGDPFHWSGRMQGWNFMCADCHSTFVERRYDERTDTFDTRSSAIDVGCEACHGPGSTHVAWNGKRGEDTGLRVALRGDHAWTRDPSTGSPRPHEGPARIEVETCAPCHSRREAIAPSHRAGTPFLDSYRPVLLEEPYYFADGQIRDEVYEWGSFATSRMHEAGVACSDCHEPHAGTLRAEGNALCTRCHEAARFDAPSHHRHAATSTGARCVACHMPERTYMGIDVRHDHGLRIPTPELSHRAGASDACGSCHRDRDAAWAEAALAGWPVRRAPRAFELAFVRAREDAEGAAPELLRLVREGAAPAMARATALEALGRTAPLELAEAVELGARDADDLVRVSAARASVALPPELRLRFVARLLADPRKAVRLEAARALADVPRETLEASTKTRLERGLEELLAAERVNADRPEAWMRIGLVELARGDLEAAERAYREALRRGPDLVEAYVNLADLARERGDEAAVESWLGQALAREPSSPEALHAMGLLRIRQRRLPDALPLLRRAAEGRPDDVGFAYVLAVALAESGDRTGAIATLGAALRRHPGQPELLDALRQLGGSAPRR
ncbi:MAG: tetratricopeptide repeat protein [Polyangiales bacterium]